MYTEGFESLEETERESRNTYGAMNETDRLLRENEKLKKSLEKEKFFNKLLDQEIQEMKMSMPNTGRQDFHSEYWSGNRGVSRGAFYLLLFVTLILGGYIGYGIYYNKPMNYLNIGKTSRPATVIQGTSVVADPTTASAAPVSASDGSDATVPPSENVSNAPENVAKPEENRKATPTAAAKDSVPNIIGGKNTAEKPKVAASAQKASVTPTADEEYNEDEVNRVINTEEKSAPAAAAPATPPVESRPVIGRYKVTSKANFYNNPDENSMRGTFISSDANKVVEALEEKDGFIYVVYTNDLGFTSRGWLSKKDLTKE